MSKHVSEITSEELDALSRAAADEPSPTLAKGVPVTGYMPDGDGNVWLARRHLAARSVAHSCGPK
jgi:hypothetical protein